MATRAVIADNQKMFSEGLQHILSSIKIPSIKIVGIAHSKDQLISFFQYPVDLVIMEIALGDGEGLKLITEIKRLNPAVKIIILSAYSEPKLVKDAF